MSSPTNSDDSNWFAPFGIVSAIMVSIAFGLATHWLFQAAMDHGMMQSRVASYKETIETHDSEIRKLRAEANELRAKLEVRQSDKPEPRISNDESLDLLKQIAKDLAELKPKSKP